MQASTIVKPKQTNFMSLVMTESKVLLDVVKSMVMIFMNCLRKKKQSLDSTLKIKCHRSCVSTYTSKSQTDQHKRKFDGPSSSGIPVKLTRRSTDTSIFSFQHQCIFCGDRCQVEKDRKNPTRWRPAYVCREVGTEVGKPSLKQSIINACNKRNDAWAEKVRRRVKEL